MSRGRPSAPEWPAAGSPRRRYSVFGPPYLELKGGRSANVVIGDSWAAFEDGTIADGDVVERVEAGRNVVAAQDCGQRVEAEQSDLATGD